MSEGKLSDQQILDIFKACDTDNNNVLSAGELMVFLRRAGLKVDAKQVHDTVKELNNGNAVLQLTAEQFTVLFKTLFPSKCYCPRECHCIKPMEQPDNTAILKQTYSAIQKKTGLYETEEQKKDKIHKQQRRLSNDDIAELFSQCAAPGSDKVSVSQLILFLSRQGYKFDFKKCFDQLKRYNVQKETDTITLEQFSGFYRNFFNARVKI